MEIEVNGIQLEITRGDIANQPDVTAVVNAANPQLRTGGGVAGALHRAAGPGLAEECRPMAPIEPGEAVISGGHDLPNAHVIHCLGPVYGRDKPEEDLLASCYREALRLAEENEIDSVAFPALSTGAFGYPMGEATEIALSTVLNATDNLEAVQTIRFVLFGQDAYDIYEAKMKELAE